MSNLFGKFLDISNIYNFFTNKIFRAAVILFILTIITYAIYKNHHDLTANEDITLKYEINTENLTVEEIKSYLEKNKFTFVSGNPLEFTNFSLLDDGVSFRRYKKDDNNIEYQYCNLYVYSLCINTNIKISELSKIYKEGSESYNNAVNIYNDYYKKIEQLNLTEEQVRNVLDYYYTQIS